MKNSTILLLVVAAVVIIGIYLYKQNQVLQAAAASPASTAATGFNSIISTIQGWFQ